MKKYLLMLLAATTLTLGVTSCGDDENEDPNKENPSKPDQPGKTIDFPNYAEAVDMNLNAMLQKYGEPMMSANGIYMYMFEQGNVAALTFMVNQENNKVYAVNEVLNDGAFTAEDIQAYFAARYTFYDRQETIYTNDEEDAYAVPDTIVVCTYGNAPKLEEATLVITVTGNTLVTYTNPTNVPDEPEITNPFDEMEPQQITQMFLGKDSDDILDGYEDAFMEMAGMYMASMEENPYLTGFALSVADGRVVAITFFYDDGLDEQTILDYYSEAGYSIRETGEEDEDGFKQYVISDGNISILYQGYMGTATIVER